MEKVNPDSRNGFYAAGYEDGKDEGRFVRKCDAEMQGERCQNAATVRAEFQFVAGAKTASNFCEAHAPKAVAESDCCVVVLADLVAK